MMYAYLHIHDECILARNTAIENVVQTLIDISLQVYFKTNKNKTELLPINVVNAQQINITYKMSTHYVIFAAF